MAIRKLTIEELAMIAIILDEEEEECPKNTRRYWIHNSIKKRKTEGEYWTLFRHLVDDEEKFFQYFRMGTFKFTDLLKKIENDIVKKNTNFRECLLPNEKFAVCLRYLATGDSFTTIAFSYRLGISTVRRAVLEVFDAVIKNVLRESIPTTVIEQWEKNIEEFWNKWNFPNCVAAIDGKHVIILAPPNSGSLYFNYKKTFSIVLMALVDANYNFIAVTVGAFGKDSDGGILSKSKMGRAIFEKKFNIPNNRFLPGANVSAPCVILGDEAFPLKNNLLRPYPSQQSINDSKKRHFNYRLCRARSVVENAFGFII